MGQSDIDLVQEIGKRITTVTQDIRETMFLISVAAYSAPKGAECDRFPEYV